MCVVVEELSLLVHKTKHEKYKTKTRLQLDSEQHVLNAIEDLAKRITRIEVPFLVLPRT